MKPFFSIVIPHFNSQKTLEPLLESIASSKGAPPYEVIVVDDGSEKALEITQWKVFVIHLKKRGGAGAARNRGAKMANGEILVFLDSDVLLFEDTLSNLSKKFREDSNIKAASGIWMKEQNSKSFFPNFKAHRDWSYWNIERNKKSPYCLFSTRIAAIQRSLFMEMGGFNEHPKLWIEDIELTHRICENHSIALAQDARVKHEFEGFWALAKKYFWRSYCWTWMYRNRKKFDPVGATFREGLAVLSGTLFIFLSLVNLFSPSPLSYLLLPLLTLHIFILRKFLLFVYREKGVWFAARSLLTGLVLYCFIFGGVVWEKLDRGRALSCP